MTERLWCTACGTVTRDQVCDCNRYGKTEYQPQFVNYADAMQKEAHEQAQRVDTLEQALHQIDAWSRAYPLRVFPEPDLKKVRDLLEAGGITLDAVSASCMRHCVEGVGKIARAALDQGLPTAEDVRGILATPSVTSKDAP